MRFQVVTAASMKIRAFWDIALCTLVGADRRFREVYCLHRPDLQRKNVCDSEYQYSDS
jgi:hypothetical protein